MLHHGTQWYTMMIKGLTELRGVGVEEHNSIPVGRDPRQHRVVQPQRHDDHLFRIRAVSWEAKGSLLCGTRNETKHHGVRYESKAARSNMMGGKTAGQGGQGGAAGAGARDPVVSHWRDYYFADARSPSPWKCLTKVEGGAAE